MDKLTILISMGYFLMKFIFTCMLYTFSKHLIVEEKTRVEEEDIARRYSEMMASKG